MKNNYFYNAAITFYEAQIAEAKAVLHLYFENSQGVADHSGILDEIKTWAAKLAEAEDILASLKENFELNK